MSKVTTEMLIVGGGPAGLAAARAASRHTTVTIIDDNPSLGGQIWRAELGRSKHKLAQHNVSVIHGQVFDRADNRSILAETKDGTSEIEFKKLIIATGARERFLPFPGWTLPNVMGAGALQALVKGGLKVAGKRVVVAGTGPLLLAVAEYLKRRGANVVALVEQAPRARLNRFAFRLFRSPSKLGQAVRLHAKLIGTRFLTDCWVTKANGSDRLQSVEIMRRDRTEIIDCDFLAFSFHLVPNIELADLLGCKIADGSVNVDEFQQTSEPKVFCAGEPTGIAGVESAIVEGEIAGLAATGQTDEARKLFAKRSRARRFGESLNNAFALREELRSLAEPDTVVCRCEDVAYDRLLEFDNFREAKLQTRCGMGSCQGRICGAATQFLLGWESPSVRPPIFPVKMENL